MSRNLLQISKRQHSAGKVLLLPVKTACAGKCKSNLTGLTRGLRSRVRNFGYDTEQSKEIEGVKIEVASLRATVETYFRVRVDPPPTAAVAEPPEDYGAD